MTTGANTTHNKFFICINFNIELSPSFLSNQKAINKITAGDNTIAIHNIQILIINTITITNSGIDIAIICHNDKDVFNTLTYRPFSDVEDNLRLVHAFIKEPYNVENTHT